jgi:hypothetical protein
MSDPPRIERHEAADRFGAAALRTAHDLGEGLAGPDADPDPVVVRTDGPHRSLAGLAALIDAALAEDGDEDGDEDGTGAGDHDGADDGDDAGRRGS